MPPTNPAVRGANPLKASGANPATPGDFRMVGADGSSEIPAAAKDYEVWALGDRLIQADGERDRRMSVRQGPNARGEGSNVAQSVQCTPPAPREPPARELPALLSAPGQVGFP